MGKHFCRQQCARNNVSSFARAFLPAFVDIEDLFMSFRFVSKQRKTSNAVGMSSMIFCLQAGELWLSVIQSKL